MFGPVPSIGSVTSHVSCGMIARHVSRRLMILTMMVDVVYAPRHAVAGLCFRIRVYCCAYCSPASGSSTFQHASVNCVILYACRKGKRDV